MAKKLTATERLLKQVTLIENPEQEDAATYAVDRVTRSVTVTVNPGQLDAEGQHLAKIRGLSQLILSGFRAYNRDMVGRYGHWPKEQQAFSKADEEASEALESVLAQAMPYTPAE